MCDDRSDLIFNTGRRRRRNFHIFGRFCKNWFFKEIHFQHCSTDTYMHITGLHTSRCQRFFFHFLFFFDRNTIKKRMKETNEKKKWIFFSPEVNVYNVFVVVCSHALLKNIYIRCHKIAQFPFMNWTNSELHCSNWLNNGVWQAYFSYVFLLLLFFLVDRRMCVCLCSYPYRIQFFLLFSPLFIRSFVPSINKWIH